MTDNKELIVNFSGGKDSTAMLHLLLEHGEKVDEVIYFDGGWEFPQMADHVALVEEKTGIKITRLTPEEGNFDYWGIHREYTDRNGVTNYGYSFPGGNIRWCTRLKVATISKYLKGRNVQHAIGFAVGEEKRAVRAILRKEDNRYPLLEYNYDESDCLDYCYKLGYTWGGLYNYMDRVSCFFCPFMSARQVANIKRHFPEIWENIRKKATEMAATMKSQNRSLVHWRVTQTFEQVDARIRGRDEEWNPAEWIEKLNIKQKPIQIEPIDNSPTLFDDED